MKIIDLNGNEIVVDNLQLAIMQADDYRHMQHIDPAHQAGDSQLQAYWTDVYNKLLQLQKDLPKSGLRDAEPRFRPVFCHSIPFGRKHGAFY